MNQTIYILISVIFLIGCNHVTKEKTTGKQIGTVLIENPLQYDQTFLHGLATCNDSIKLIKNYLIIKNDTAIFPTDLTINKTTIFKGFSKSNTYSLTVKRTNLTNLQYNFKLIDKQNYILLEKTGIAILGSMFFLAPEGDYDNEMGAGYASSEYLDNSGKCFFSIRIGIGKDYYGKLRAKIICECEYNNKQKIDLDECPTLKTE